MACIKRELDMSEEKNFVRGDKVRVIKGFDGIRKGAIGEVVLVSEGCNNIDKMFTVEFDRHRQVPMISNEIDAY